jgi:succinoglycan biosynthesis transport protein ExoP
MSIVQFLRIFWARRLFILAATVSCLVGAYVVTLIIPPRWQAHSRVMLNLLKPDPVTGVTMGAAARVYAATQVELITDYAVAGQVADQLGWLSDPALIEAYEHRSRNDKRDFRRWLAQLVIDNTKAEILQDSNILEITYTATTPDAAKGVADALRTAYLNASLQFQRDDAQRNAEWFSAQADKAKTAYDAAVAARTDYEKANGIVMADDKTDVDSARLQALASQAGVAPAMVAAGATQSSASAIELAQVDAQISEDSKTLGPNHPDLLALRARRQVLAGLVAQDQAAAKAAIGAASSASAATVGALERAVTAQKAKVIGKADKIGTLTQLQSEVDLRHDEFTATSAKAAQFRQEAALSDSGLTPLGAAVTPKSPQFPNYMLIIPGSLFLGLAVGVLVALLMELFGRRVRGVEDLASVVDLPLLAVVAAAPNPRSSRSFRRAWRPPSLPWPRRRKVVQA